MATDTFTNTDGTDLTAHNANWKVPSGGIGMEIIFNTAACVNNSGTFNANYYDVTVANAHTSSAVLDATYTEYAGPAVRIQAGSNSFYYAIVANDGTCYVGECTNGSGTDFDSGNAGFAPGDKVTLEIDASTPSTIRLKKNDVLVQTYSGKTSLSGGKYGVCSVNSQVSAQLTSWEGIDTSAGGSAVTGTGAATGPAATTSGTGVRHVLGTGAATAAPTTTSGSGTVNGASQSVTGTGALTAAIATTSGAGSRGVRDMPGDINVSTSIPTIAGSGTVSAPDGPDAITGTGGLSTPANSAAGLGIRGIHGTGACSMVIPTTRGFQVMPVGRIYQDFGFGLQMRF